MEPIPEIATKIDITLDHHRFVRHIHKFDGFMLLGEFVDDKGNTYIWSWCDCEDGGLPPSRYLVVQVEKQDVENYLNEKISQRTLMMYGSVKLCYLIDWSDNPTLWSLRVKDVPENYFPIEDTYYEAFL